MTGYQTWTAYWHPIWKFGLIRLTDIKSYWMGINWVLINVFKKADIVNLKENAMQKEV